MPIRVALIDQNDVTHLPMHGRARAGIGYPPQEASIFRKLSVADNIMAILETRKDLTAVAASRHWKACCRNSTSTISVTASA